MPRKKKTEDIVGVIEKPKAKKKGGKKKGASAWINFVKAHWKKKQETYGQALSRCSKIYKKSA